MEEKTVDVKKRTPEEQQEMNRQAQLVFRFNNTQPFTDEWWRLMKEIFKGKFGENSRVMSPLTVVHPQDVTIGRNVVVMNGCLMM
jgi:hypothetical protein